MTRPGKIFRTIDYSGTPAAKVGNDDRRACADSPMWWWFALPLPRGRHASSRYTDPIAHPGGDDQKAAKAAHRRAQSLCVSCPLSLVCAKAAFDTEEFGLFGGMTASDRYHLGGRGHATNNSKRTYEGWIGAVSNVMAAFGPNHPVTKWVVSLPVPRGVEKPEPLALPDEAA